jgi:hypothetical protein
MEAFFCGAGVLAAVCELSLSLLPALPLLPQLKAEITNAEKSTIINLDDNMMDFIILLITSFTVL